MAASKSVVEVSYSYTQGTRRYTNQLHYVQAQSDPLPVDVAAHANLISGDAAGNWQTNVTPQQADAFILDRIFVNEIDVFLLEPTIPPAPAGTPQHGKPRYNVKVEVPLLVAIPGGVEGDFLPNFNSYRARKQSLVPSRRARGHISIAGIPEAFTIANELTAGGLDWVTGNAAVLIQHVISYSTGGNTYVLNPVIFSTRSGLDFTVDLQPAMQTTVPISAVIANSIIGTMRRRKVKAVSS